MWFGPGSLKPAATASAIFPVGVVCVVAEHGERTRRLGGPRLLKGTPVCSSQTQIESQQCCVWALLAGSRHGNIGRPSVLDYSKKHFVHLLKKDSEDGAEFERSLIFGTPPTSTLR